jgi:hypothetical protein
MLRATLKNPKNVPDTRTVRDMHFRAFPLLRVLVASAAALCCSGGSSVLAQQPTTQQQRVQAIADDLRVRLEIPQAVRVSMVDTNHLLMSVEPVEPAERSTERAFALYVEAAFVATLDDTELAAAVAHELGHVWIFTHHPFLQTEQLANEVAMRLVTRDELALLYDKVWKRAGTKGDLMRFLGPESQAGLAPARPVAAAEPDNTVQR